MQSKLWQVMWWRLRENLAILLLFSLASQRRRQISVERFETCVLNFVLVSVGKNFHHSSTISSARKRIKEEEKETSNMESNLQLISVSWLRSRMENFKYFLEKEGEREGDSSKGEGNFGSRLSRSRQRFVINHAMRGIYAYIEREKDREGRRRE